MTTTKHTLPTDEIQAVSAIYEAINRNEPDVTLRFFDPEIVRVEPVGFPTAGIYRGHTEMAAHLAQGRSTWAEGGCIPERFFIAGDRVVVFLHVLVRLKSRTDWIDGHMADVFTFRNGKVTEMRSFADLQEALNWVGISEDSAGSFTP